MSLLPVELQHAQRRLRIVGILSAAHDAGLVPLRLRHLHLIAYLSDALAPVWNLPFLDFELLKLPRGPFYPRLQNDVDSLVGMGLLIPIEVRHIEEEGIWRLDASYSLNSVLAGPVLTMVASLEQKFDEMRFLREIVFSVAAARINQITELKDVDLAYANPVIDMDDVIDLTSNDDIPNLAATLALRFGALASSERSLSQSEMVNYYVRHLYKQLNAA
jgi:hypothetical protein